MIDGFSVGDRVIMKKPHACGENLWQITRTGADVKIKCLHCGRLIMLDRLEFMKRGKKLLPKSEENNAD
ncbi:MAG: DUF951 domain-containing protein [Clostridia bacterium]|nr:DUF951 domain-containing protein [Clostridia bacterium]